VRRLSIFEGARLDGEFRTANAVKLATGTMRHAVDVVVGIAKGANMRQRVFGLIGVLLGGFALLSFFSGNGTRGNAGYQMGGCFGLILAALLFFVGLTALLKGDGPKKSLPDPRAAKDAVRGLKRAIREALELENEGDIDAAIFQYRKVARLAGVGHPSEEMARDRIEALERAREAGDDRIDAPPASEPVEVQAVNSPLVCTCGKTLSIPAALVGKKVRCPSCKAVLMVPAASSAEAIAEQPLPPLPEAARRSRYDEPDLRSRDDRSGSRRNRSEDARSRPVESSGMSVLQLFLIVGGIGVLTLVVAVGAMTWLYLADVPNGGNPRPQFPMVQEGGQVPPFDPRPFERPPPPNDVPQPVPQPPQQQQQQQQQQQPEPPRQRIVPVKFADGKFEERIDFGPGQTIGRSVRFEFSARAGSAYRASIEPNQRLQISADGPGLVSNFDGPWLSEIAVAASQDGVYAVLLRSRGDRTCTLTIRELEGGAVVPAAVRVKGDALLLPTIAPIEKLNPNAKSWSSAAFNSDGSEFWMAHKDNTVSRWDSNAMREKCSFKSTDEARVVTVGADSRGRLFGQTKRGRQYGRDDLPVGDIAIWEKLSKTASGAMPAPTKTIALQGSVRRFLNSPDRNWIYFIDIHNGKLGRVRFDVDSAETIDLSKGAADFCVTPSGRFLYACSKDNRIDIVDAATFKIKRTVRISEGAPRSIAATNEGIVYLTGDWLRPHPGEFGKTKCFAVDLSAVQPAAKQDEPFPVIGFPSVNEITVNNVVLLPDQRAALFGGDRMFMTVAVVPRPGLFRSPSQEVDVSGMFTGGDVVVSPNGRLLLQNAGVILAIGQ
jgi:hypothetical protein